MDWKITRVAETGSTNADVAALAAAGAAEGTVVAASRQTVGRGRQGRVWISQDGAGLYFSVLLRPDLPPERAASMPLAVGVAVARALGRLLPGGAVSIKWPNDILARGRKLCGILCEMGCGPSGVRHVVAGIGINVNLDVSTLPPDVAATATSLMSLAGRAFDGDSVLRAVLDELGAVYDVWLRSGLAALGDELAGRDCLRGRRIEMRLLGEPLEGVAEGIADSGALLVRRDDGRVEEVFSGEAHIVRAGIGPGTSREFDLQHCHPIGI